MLAVVNMSSTPGMNDVTDMTRWDNSLAYCRATLRIVMMTDAAMFVVKQAVEHATIPMQAMISIADMRICATRKAIENAATQRHIVVKKTRMVAATSSIVAMDVFCTSSLSNRALLARYIPVALTIDVAG